MDTVRDELPAVRSELLYKQKYSGGLERCGNFTGRGSIGGYKSSHPGLNIGTRSFGTFSEINLGWQIFAARSGDSGAKFPFALKVLSNKRNDNNKNTKHIRRL
jgi:hypothetical protein